MLEHRQLRILLSVALLILLSGCRSLPTEDNHVRLHSNQGIFFNKDHELFPIYSLKLLDSSNLIGQQLNDETLRESLIEIFYNEREKMDIPVNELKVNQELKLHLNKNFKKPLIVNTIYSDQQKKIIIPYEWENEEYVQFDVNDLKKHVVYTFQVTYISQKKT